MPNAVIDTTTGTGYTKAWGDVDFTPLLGPGEAQVAVNDDSPRPDPNEPLYHYGVVGGNFALLSPANQAIADADVSAADNATLKNAQVVARVFQTAAQLPLPPPISRALVAVVNGPGGLPGLALSTNTQWILFAADSSVGP